MKILHFGKFYPPFNGGMEIYLRDLAEQQSKKHSVTALVHNHEFKTLTSPSVNETINQVNVIRQKTLKPILFTPIMLGVNKVISLLIRSDKVDIIHVSWPNPSALLLLLNKKAKSKPWVLQWQSDMITQHSSLLLKFAYLFFKPFEKMLLKQSHAIIASTEEYANHSNALSAFRDKCCFIPLGLKKRSCKVEPKDTTWANGLWNDAAYKIYNIGRLTFYKNHQLLINAAEKMPTAHFIITGTGNLENHLKSLIAKKSLTNIILTGSLSKNRLNALLNTCDAFCLASNDRAESYGMVLIEALNANKPLLVSNLSGSGMKWIASQSHNAATFDCNNANDLIEKIKTLKSQANLSAHSQSYKQDIQQFSIENCSNKTDELYQSLINFLDQ